MDTGPLASIAPTLRSGSARALLLAVALVAWLAPDAARAQSCWIGMPAASSGVTLDGNRNTTTSEWASAGSAISGDGCLEFVADRSSDGAMPPNAVYTPRVVRVYAQRDASFIYLAFDVDDQTQNLQPGTLGERIIVQIDPNHDRSATLGPGPGAAFDYRIDITHRGSHAASGITLKNSSNTTSVCGVRTWGNVTTPAPADLDYHVAPRPAGYVVEIKVRASTVGVTIPSTIGLAFAVVNDMNDVAAQTASFAIQYGAAAFPAATLHFTSSANGVLDPALNSNPVGCSDWLVPAKWGHGYMTTGPTDVTITRLPAAWNSDGIALLNCASAGYSYWPHHPCRITTRATVTNSGSAAAQRNVLYLWGNRDAASARWSFMGLIKGVTVPPGNFTVPDVEWAVPNSQWGLGEHPCMRVIVLPTSFRVDFDEARMVGLANADNTVFQELMDKYGLQDNNWAQKNISRVNDLVNDCPNGACLSLGDPLGRPLQFASMGWPFTGALSLLQREPEATPQRPGQIYLNRRDLDLYGRTDQIVQVQSFGYRPTATDAPYAFIEIVGGAIELIPLQRLQAGPVDVSFTFTNGAPSTMTLIPVVDVRAPAGSRSITVTFDRRPITLEGNQSRTVQTTVRLGGRGGLQGPGSGPGQPGGGGGKGCFGRVGTTGSVGILLGFAVFGIAIRRRRDA